MPDISKLSDAELMAIMAREESARRSIQNLSEDQLRALAYEQPEPPPGVTIHASNGDFYSKGGGKFEPTTPLEAQARAQRDASGISGDVGASVLRGTPYVGGFMDRAIAAGNSALGGGTYEDQLARKRAEFKTFDEDYPKTSMAGKAAGAIAGTVASAPLAGEGIAGWALGTGAKSLPQAIVRGGVAGTLQGAAAGAGESQDLTKPADVALNVAKDGAIGAVLGTAIPAALGGAARVWDKLNPIGAATDALANLPAKAQQYIAQQLPNAARVQALKQQAAALGPEGMLADVSPEWAGIARGASARPGSRDAIVQALTERDAGKNARITGAINDTLGPDVVPSQRLAGIKDAQKALGPEYEQALQGAKAVDTEPLLHRLTEISVDARGPARQAARDVKSMLNIEGTDQLDPNPRTLLNIRHAIDGMMEGQENTDVLRVLGDARKAVDAELQTKVPGIKTVDAKYGELARQADSFKQGQNLLDSGKQALRPSEVQDLVEKGVQPQGELVGPSAAALRLREGTRAEIERIVGTNANDVAKLNQLFKAEGDWNRDKLRTLFGQDRADKILQTLDAERKMEATKNWVVGNSATEPTRQFGQFLDETAKGHAIPTETTLAGASFRGAQKFLQALTQSAGEEQAQEVARQLGALAVAKGGTRDQIIEALMKRGVRQGQLEQLYGAAGGSTALSPVVRALMAGSSGDRAEGRRQR
ncbi:hypothetical protein SLNSH_22835 [Alsobacter soli]|uniref:Uncharacterized protein n=1 Tax=Alsobacter soli TaxID=2109933 RepID=A0A2T1HM18_9HYPH|nr:hypothetical protein [Alsobacter soli]PSC02700.1 hypothetical protein SLNSH_22835 [Alsobacter soli]